MEKKESTGPKWRGTAEIRRGRNSEKEVVCPKETNFPVLFLLFSSLKKRSWCVPFTTSTSAADCWSKRSRLKGSALHTGLLLPHNIHPRGLKMSSGDRVMSFLPAGGCPEAPLVCKKLGLCPEIDTACSSRGRTDSPTSPSG